jgi:hypothetical protein
MRPRDRRHPGHAAVAQHRRQAAAHRAPAGGARCPVHDQAAGQGRGPGGPHLLPHLPGHRHHGLPGGRGHGRSRPAILPPLTGLSRLGTPKPLLGIPGRAWLLSRAGALWQHPSRTEVGSTFSSATRRPDPDNSPRWHQPQLHRTFRADRRRLLPLEATPAGRAQTSHATNASPASCPPGSCSRRPARHDHGAVTVEVIPQKCRSGKEGVMLMDEAQRRHKERERTRRRGLRQSAPDPLFFLGPQDVVSSNL